ncbi:MAG: alpha/beta fold hydrolase [Bacteroidetes bacterium]|nr:alpha/beta fold hydrolase [Bacteroidota bacterium]
MKIVWTLLLFAFLPILIEAQTNKQSTKQPADQYVVVEGSKMHYQTSGTGSATVVFESGHGDNLNTWNSVFSETAKFAKAVRYDREGYGLSETITQPTSYRQIAARLHELLQKANINSPYILVGHSLGGALIRAYAKLYPTEVAGFVFVDPLNEYMGAKWTQEQKIKQVTSDESGVRRDSMAMKTGAATYMAEWKIMRQDLLNGFSEINSFALPDVPMVLLVAGKNPFLRNGLRELYANEMSELSEARFTELAQSPHNIQNYDPAVVVEAIRRVVFPDAENSLRKTLATKGVDSCIYLYRKLKQTYPKEYIIERYLNTLGYEELKNSHAQEAIKLFKLNVEMYPESSNVYDSLGEAYMNAGNTKEAIVNYNKSLAINPYNTNAEEMLKKLK